MRRASSLALAALLGLPVALQAEPVDYDMVTRIRHEGLQRSQVMDTLRELTERHGPRLTGSPALREASDWARDQFTEWGLRDARLEPFEFGQGWSFSSTYVRAIAPFEGPLRALPQAWSVGTDGPVRGSAVLLKLHSEKDFKAHRGKLQGRIVVLEPDPPPPRRGFVPPPPADPAQERPYQRHDEASLKEVSAFRIPGESEADPWLEHARKQWRFNDQRNRFLQEEGALAMIQKSIRSHGILWVTGGGGRGLADRAPGVPSLAMSEEHYSRIVRALRDKREVELELAVEARFHDDGPVHNVLADIPGNDRRGEIVMAGAHIDSWHAGTGATDNGAGVAVVMEAARILRALDVKPRRSIRFALWTGEEQGLLGSKAYVERHLASRPPPEDPTLRELPDWFWGDTWPISPLTGHARHSVYFNLDNGSGRIRGVYAQENSAAVPIFRAWLEPFADLGASVVTLRNTGGTDHVSFDRVGLPGFQFVQDGLAYMTRTWHTDLDTLDHVSREDLMQAATIMASFLYHAAMRPERFPRKPMPLPPLPRKSEAEADAEPEPVDAEPDADIGSELQSGFEPSPEALAPEQQGSELREAAGGSEPAR